MLARSTSEEGGGDFAVARPIAHARLYATALGVYEAQINGQRVGDALLSPESTDFRKTALYQVHDVTDLLKPGDNAIGADWFGRSHDHG